MEAIAIKLITAAIVGAMIAWAYTHQPGQVDGWQDYQEEQW